MQITQITFPQQDICCVQVREDAASYEAVIQQYYERFGKFYPVPGYEKGQAPRQAIEQQYGVQVFRLEAINHLLTYEFPALQAQLCTERGLTPLTEPEPELLRDDTDGFAVACTFALIPDKPVTGYTGQTLPADPKTGVKLLLTQVAEQNGILPCGYAVETEAANRRAALEDKLREAKTTLDAFLQQSGKTEADLQADLRAGAQADLAQRIVLHNITRQEGLFTTPQQLEEEIGRMEAISPQNSYVRSNPAAQRSVCARLANQRTLDWLRQQNQFIESV